MTNTPKQIIAQAIADTLTSPASSFAGLLASAAIKALADAGWAIVPVDPTREMVRAGHRELNDKFDTDEGDAYRAMLKAAP